MQEQGQEVDEESEADDSSDEDGEEDGGGRKKEKKNQIWVTFQRQEALRLFVDEHPKVKAIVERYRSGEFGEQVPQIPDDLNDDIEEGLGDKVALWKQR